MTGAQRTGDSSSVRIASHDGKRTGLFLDSIAVLILGLAAFLVGCFLNAFRAEPLSWKYRSREQILSARVAHLQVTIASPAGANGNPDATREIRLEEFQSFVAAHTGAVIDARPAVFYKTAHVPGALNLPRETLAEDYPRLRGRLEGEKNRLIAVYCSGADCPDSQLVADALTKLGYRKLAIYTSGWEEWSQTGLPQEGDAASP